MKRIMLGSCVVLFGSLLMLGCTTDNVMSTKTNANIFRGTPGPVRPASDNKVYLTKEQIHEKDGYKVLGEISVSNLRKDGEDKILQKIGNRAWEVGADAVMQVSVWWQPTTEAWAAPQGFGIAIKLDKNSTVDLTKYDGKWWNAYKEPEVKKPEQQIDG